MKQADIKIGGLYTIKHHDGMIHTVRVLHTKRSSFLRSRETLHYICRKLSTDRDIEVKSAAKFRSEVAS